MWQLLEICDWKWQQLTMKTSDYNFSIWTNDTMTMWKAMIKLFETQWSIDMTTFEAGRMSFTSNIIDVWENKMKQNRNGDEKEVLMETVAIDD